MTNPTDDEQLESLLAGFIMQYDQKIKICNKRNVDATERAKAALLAWRNASVIKMLPKDDIDAELSARYDLNIPEEVEGFRVAIRLVAVIFNGTGEKK